MSKESKNEWMLFSYYARKKADEFERRVGAMSSGVYVVLAMAFSTIALVAAEVATNDLTDEILRDMQARIAASKAKRGESG